MKPFPFAIWPLEKAVGQRVRTMMFPEEKKRFRSLKKKPGGEFFPFPKSQYWDSTQYSKHYKDNLLHGRFGPDRSIYVRIERWPWHAGSDGGEIINWGRRSAEDLDIFGSRKFGLDRIKHRYAHWKIDKISSKPGGKSSLLDPDVEMEIFDALHRNGVRSLSWDADSREGVANRRMLFQRFCDRYHELMGNEGGVIPQDSYPRSKRSDYHLVD